MKEAWIKHNKAVGFCVSSYHLPARRQDGEWMCQANLGSNTSCNIYCLCDLGQNIYPPWASVSLHVKHECSPRDAQWSNTDKICNNSNYESPFHGWPSSSYFTYTIIFNRHWSTMSLYCSCSSEKLRNLSKVTQFMDEGWTQILDFKGSSRMYQLLSTSWFPFPFFSNYLMCYAELSLRLCPTLWHCGP